MNSIKRISQVYKSAEVIPFDDSSRIILMSDCHRGDGSSADNFLKNRNIYISALNHYYRNNYTYIEIGDGDELWENKRLTDIMYVHKDVFWLLSKFYNKGRLHFIYGNHDMEKKYYGFARKKMRNCFDKRDEEYLSIFKKIKVHEGLILRHKETNDSILLLHGHQTSLLNSTFWKFSRFLVRYVWRPLETFGVNDPTSTAKNYNKKITVGNKLKEWVMLKKHMLIAGHTHKPMYPDVGQPPYFNDGCCIHPRCLTAIEITEGNICLVKWSVKVKCDGTLYIDRDVLAGPNKLEDYFLYFKN